MASALDRVGGWLRGDGSYRRLEVLSLIGVALIGLTALAEPLWANQATFALYASGIKNGDVLYRDLVDLKQPGVFIYYLIAQLPFGRNGIGIHLVELLTWLTFGAVLQRQARSWFHRPWLAATLPLPVIGTYYLSATYNDLTQVEALINIPMLAAVMLGMPDNDGNVSSKRYFLAGLATAIVALLKLPYAVIPVAIWLPTLVRNTRADWRNTLRTMVGPAAAGAAVVVVPFLIYLAAYGLYDEVYDLYFKYSGERNDLWPRPKDRLWFSTRRTLRIFSPHLALIAVGLVLGGRRLIHRRSLAMVAWGLIAVPLFLIQQWWSYHAFLWLVPVTITGWFAIDAIIRAGRPRTDRGLLAGMTVVALVFLTQVAPDGVDKLTRLAENDFALTEEGRDGFRADADPAYRDALAWRAWNQEIGENDAAWTLGVSPGFLFVAGQEHHLPILSWPVQFLRDQDWERINAELMTDPPERLIVIDDVYDAMAVRSPSTLAIVTADYCVAREVGPYDFLLPSDDPNCP